MLTVLKKVRSNFRLKPEWTIGDVKSKVKSVIEDGNGSDTEVDLRMILAGRELGDTVRCVFS